VKLYAAYIDKPTCCIKIVLEFMDLGSLADVFRKRRVKVPEPILAFLTMQMLEALKVGMEIIRYNAGV
jgi:serine/threonine protein kinase